MTVFTSQRLSLGALVCLAWVGCASQAEPSAEAPPPAAPSGATTAPSTTAGAAAPAVASPGVPVAPTGQTVTTAPASAPAQSNTESASTAPAVPTETKPAEAAPSVTYHKDIRPIMAANCSMACHGPDPKLRTGPIALDTYAAVKPVGALVVDAVMNNRMPPWPPDADCRELRDTPSITQEQRALFKTWQEAGFAEGNEADYVEPEVSLAAELGPPTRIITMAQAHTPPANTDEYTCARPDYTFDKDTYIRAIEVLPDQKATVHHVQVHVVSGSACTTGDNIYSWRPGGQRLVFNEGDAALIKRGSSFNFQMHYNTIGKDPTPDKTQIAVWELPEGTKPEREVTRVGVFALPPILTPGAVQTSTANQNVGGAGTEIIGVSPHAHMIAKTMTADLKRAGGKTECLTKISDWKFEWQMDYIFKEPLPLAAGDSVEAKCGYDNTPDHQPVVDGVKREQPITVVPGEGTSDEMCLHYIWLRKPVR